MTNLKVGFKMEIEKIVMDAKLGDVDAILKLKSLAKDGNAKATDTLESLY